MKIYLLVGDELVEIENDDYYARGDVLNAQADLAEQAGDVEKAKQLRGEAERYYDRAAEQRAMSSWW